MKPPALAADAALFLDLDGTLLEIAPQPELVRVPAGLPALLDRLAAERGGALALVSGRKLSDIDALCQPWHGAAAGLHGIERRRPDGVYVPPGETEADRHAAAALAALRPELDDIVRRWPGARLEDKGRTLALHYRQAPEAADDIQNRAEALGRQYGDRLRLIAGKMVCEFQPHHHGKHGAIAAFMAEPPFLGRTPVFVGDDTTDEDGFAEVNRRGGVSIRVGEVLAGSAAQYRLPLVTSVLDWLGLLR